MYEVICVRLMIIMHAAFHIHVLGGDYGSIFILGNTLPSTTLSSCFNILDPMPMKVTHMLLTTNAKLNKHQLTINVFTFFY